MYNENGYFPETIIFTTKNNEFGIRSKGATTFYDAIDFSDAYNIKVKKDNLWGYFKTSELKYKKLAPFVYNLARFELANGKKGYIDLKGTEYFN